MAPDTTLVWAKPWTWSRTMWLNIIGFGVIMLEVVQGWMGVTTIPLPSWTMEITALVLALGNAAMRFVTDRPITAHLSPRPASVETKQPKRGLS